MSCIIFICRAMNNILSLTSIPQPAQVPVLDSHVGSSDNIHNNQIDRAVLLVGFAEALDSELNNMELLSEPSMDDHGIEPNLLAQTGNSLPLPQNLLSISSVAEHTEVQQSAITPSMGQNNRSSISYTSDELLPQSTQTLQADKKQITAIDVAVDRAIPLSDSSGKRTAITGTQADPNQLNDSINGYKNNEPSNMLQPPRELLNQFHLASLAAKMSQKNDYMSLNQAIRINTPDPGISTDSPAAINANLNSLYQADTAKPVSLLFNTLPDSSQWTSEFSDKVRWLIGNNIKQAELHLNPKELGKIEIKISIHADQASVSITTHNPATRELIESSAIKLKEMLEQSLESNINVDVKQHSQHHSHDEKTAHEIENRKYSAEIIELPTVVTPIDSNSLIDLYA